jgi:hypothetical protein
MYRKQDQVWVLGQHVDQRPAGLLQNHGNAPATKTLLQPGRPNFDGFGRVVQFPCSCRWEPAGSSRQKFFWPAQSMAANAAHSGSDAAVINDSDMMQILLVGTGWLGSSERSIPHLRNNLFLCDNKLPSLRTIKACGADPSGAA